MHVMRIKFLCTQAEQDQLVERHNIEKRELQLIVQQVPTTPRNVADLTQANPRVVVAATNLSTQNVHSNFNLSDSESAKFDF